MEREEIITMISCRVNEYRRLNQLGPVDVREEDHLLDGSLGIDSLDLASLVVDLEEVTGRDPFSQGIINFETAGELAALYSGRCE